METDLQEKWNKAIEKNLYWLKNEYKTQKIDNIYCFYCKAVIDKKKDYCRCCKGALSIFMCPWCCGLMEVRCFREECAVKASEEETCQGGGVGKEYFLREYCAECTDCSKHENCSLTLNDIICIDCGELRESTGDGIPCACEIKNYFNR